MAWLNLIAIVILQKPALAALRDYQRQRKAKVADYDFDPVALGIRNAHYWEQRKAGLEPDLPEPGKSDRCSRSPGKAKGRTRGGSVDAARPGCASLIRSAELSRFLIPGYFGTSPTAPSLRYVVPLNLRLHRRQANSKEARQV